MNGRPRNRGLLTLLAVVIVIGSTPPIGIPPAAASPSMPVQRFRSEADAIVANPSTLIFTDTGFSSSLIETTVGTAITIVNQTGSERRIVLSHQPAGLTWTFLPFAAKGANPSGAVSSSNSATTVGANGPRSAPSASEERIAIPAGGSIQRSWPSPSNVRVTEETSGRRATIAIRAPLTDSRGRILGQIIDFKTKAPLRNATVKALNTSHQTTTDDAGFYSLPLPAGEYTLSLFASGYSFSNRQVTVDNFSPQQLDPIELVPLDQKVDPIGAGGGTAVNSDATTNVGFATSAVDSTKAVRLTVLPTDESIGDYKALPDTFPGGQIPLGFVLFEPDGTTFGAPAIWTIDYDGPLPIGTNSSNGLFCYYWIEAEARWGEPVPAEVVDQGNGKKGLRATLPHFSTYGHAYPPESGAKPPRLPGTPKDPSKPSGPDNPRKPGPADPKDNPNCPGCPNNQALGSTVNVMSGELSLMVGTPGLPSAGGLPSQITARYRSTSLANSFAIRTSAEQEPNSTSPTSRQWSFSIAGRSWRGDGAEIAVDWDGTNSLGEPQPPGAAIGYLTASWGYRTSNGWSIFTDVAEYPVTVQRPDLSPFGLGWFGPHDILLIDRGRSVSIIQADSREVVWLLTPTGYLAQAGEFSALAKNADGTWTRTFRDGSMTDFNADGRLTKIADRYGNFQLVQYEPNGKSVSPGNWGITSRIKRVIDTSNNSFEYSYDGTGWLTSIVDNTGRTTTFEHDSAGRLTAAVDVLGQRESFEYDSRGGITSHTDRRNSRTSYQLDDRGRLVSRVWPTGTTLQLGQVGATTTITNDLGVVSRIAMDNEFNPVSTFNGIFSMTVTYDDALLPQNDGRTGTTTLYDAAGNPIRVLGANETVFEYGAFDQPTRVRRADGSDNRVEYDAKGNPVRVTDVLGQQYTMSSNTGGQVTAIVDPLGNRTTMDYDSRGLLTKLTDPLGRETSYQYDSRGNRTTLTDARGNRTAWEYDALGQVTAVVDALNGRSTLTYDPNGNLTRYADPTGRATTYQYDALDRRTKSTYPDGGSDTIAYDAIGNPTTIIDARGRTIAMQYDAASRLARKQVEGGPTVGYAYDRFDQVTGRDDGVLSTTVRYLPGTVGLPDEINQRATGLPLSSIVNYDYGQILTNPPLATPPIATTGALPVQTVNGDLTSNTVWVGDTVYRITSQIVVKPGVTLTIQPGAVVKMLSCSNVACEGRIIVEDGASLIAQGTAAKPVAITSLRDDTLGGDTNGDGAASRPADGDWVGVFTGAASVVTLTDAIVRYGGQDVFYLATNTNAAIRAFGSTITATRVRFDQNRHRAIRGVDSKVTVDSSVFTDGGGVTYYAGNATPASATLSLTGNTFIRSGALASFDGGPAMPLTVARNRADVASTLRLVGTLPGDLDYDNPFGPYLIASSALVVPASRTLTMRAGTALKILHTICSGCPKGSVSINGTLRALGTKDLPVAIGYDPLDDFGVLRPGFTYLNSPVYPSYGVGSGGRLELAYATMQTADGTLVSADGGATVIVDHSTFNGATIGIQSNGATLSVTNSNFLVRDAGINTGAAAVGVATGNYWGAPGGPTTPSNPAIERGANLFGSLVYTPSSAAMVVPSGGRMLGSTIRTVTNTTQLERYRYDAAGRKMEATAAGYAFHTFGFGYDAANRITSRTTLSGSAPSYAYAYDAAGQLTGLTIRAPGGAVLIEESYGYDANGNLTSRTTNGVPTAYAYDSLNRLASAGGTAYAYDAVGNRTGAGGTTLAYDAGGRLTSSSAGVTYGYDAAGNLTTRTDGGGTTTLSWDTQDRLTRVDLPGGQFAAYGYDDGGRRISRRTPDGVTQYYVYQGDLLMQEVDASGTVIASYSYDGLDRPASMWRNGQTYYYLADRLGSVLGLVDSAGTVVRTYAYDAWGVQTSTTGTLVNPLRWAGRELDEESGLYYLRARYYDPSAGRFISRDPIGLAGGPNLYAYALNNPIVLTDPFGLKGWAGTLGAGGATAGAAIGGIGGSLVGGFFGAAAGAPAGGIGIVPGALLGGTALGTAGAAGLGAAGAILGLGVGGFLDWLDWHKDHVPTPPPPGPSPGGPNGGAKDLCDYFEGLRDSAKAVGGRAANDARNAVGGPRRPPRPTPALSDPFGARANERAPGQGGI
ncbi:MAG: RHS repeat-associated core domain-containing protein [Dehalococcoidia bacterium]